MNRPDSGSVQAQYRITDLLHHPADDPVAALVNDDAQQRTSRFASERAHLLRDDLFAVDNNSRAQAFQYLRWREAVQQDFILFFKLKPRMRDAVEQVAVIGEQQQAGRLPVQSTDWDHTLRDIDQIENRAAATLVAGGRDIAGRLVQHQIAPPLIFEQIAIHSDLLTLRVDSRP